MVSVASRILLAALILSSFTSLAQPSKTYLFEQLKQPTYLQSFNALFNGEDDLEPWLKAYIENRDGVETPRQFRPIGEQTFEVYQVCEPHNCPENFLFVLFMPDGAQAWGLFTKDDGASRYFGNPDSNIKEALRAIEEDSL